MQRREFMKVVSLGAAGLTLPTPVWAKGTKKAAGLSSKENGTLQEKWKAAAFTTEVNSHVEAPAKIWLPVPAARTSYQELLSTRWQGNYSSAALVSDKTYGGTYFYAEWEKPGDLQLSVSHEVRLRNRHGVEPSSAEEAELYLMPTYHVQTDGLVAQTASKAVKHEKNPDKKARLIYEWMVDNTFRDAKVRGCGLGDVKSLLQSGNLGGKCADLSSLFVGLCRACGIPAREAFGLRVLDSHTSKSLGKAGDVSKGQHCRAEYYSSTRGGWVPVDPADVRKVVLEENLDAKSLHVQEVRHELFGYWEMNWVMFNHARDFKLPPQEQREVNYMMYPFLMTGKTEKDGMDPKDFNYSIHSKEIAAT